MTEWRSPLRHRSQFSPHAIVSTSVGWDGGKGVKNYHKREKSLQSYKDGPF